MVLPNVFAVTVNWNRPKETCACIDSLLNQNNFHLQIVIVDNGSSDNSVEFIRARYQTDSIHLIESSTNTGFAGGYNAGMRHALECGADFILIINNDAEAEPDMGHRLLSGMEEKIGVVAPAIFYSDAPRRLWSSGGTISPILLEPKDAHSRKKPLPAVQVRRTFLSGCALLFRRQVLEQVGLFDERFFVYYEDLDLCMRMQQAGIKMALVPGAVVYHKVSLSSDGSDSTLERYHTARSSGIYFRKHMHGLYPLWIIPYRFGSALLWTVRLLLRWKTKALVAYWQGLVDGWMRPQP